jgi:NADH dehydrogenase FAD-containing subunit
MCATLCWSAAATPGSHRLGAGETTAALRGRDHGIDPRAYIIHAPFLPEVAAGSVEARHEAVSLSRHLRRSKVIAAMVMRIDHARGG